jgi:hypothetical protein
MPVLFAEMRARAALRQVARVNALIDTVLSLPRESNYSPGGFMLMAYEELRAHDEVDAATVMLNRAITWFQTRPLTGLDSLQLIAHLGGAFYYAGRWDEAEKLFSNAVHDQKYYSTLALGFLGAIAARRGDRAAANQVLATLEGLTFVDEWLAFEAKFGRARIKALLGESEEALRLLIDAIGDQGRDLHTEFDFESLADNPEFIKFTTPKGVG